MRESRPSNSADQDQPDSEDHPDVTAHECSGERTVFTESGNNDGWIATDLTVPLRR